MSFKRPDGRKVTEPRPMSGKVGIVPNADGSAMFQLARPQLMLQYMVQEMYSLDLCRILEGEF